ncbi:hypothetical protein HK099_002374, partial [Clydaea vesicula]
MDNLETGVGGGEAVKSFSKKNYGDPSPISTTDTPNKSYILRKGDRNKNYGDPDTTVEKRNRNKESKYGGSNYGSSSSTIFDDEKSSIVSETPPIIPVLLKREVSFANEIKFAGLAANAEVAKPKLPLSKGK